MKKSIAFVLIIFALTQGYVSAQVNIGEDPVNIQGIVIDPQTPSASTINNNSISVNSSIFSDIWLANECLNGECDNVIDIVSYLATLFLNKTSDDNITGQLTVSSGNGRIISTNAGGALVVETETLQPGAISFGNTADIGISQDGIEGNNWDSDGSFIFKQKASNPDGLGEFVFIEENSAWRFALPSSGADLGTYNPRSMIISGPSWNNDTNFYCSAWGFTNLDCNTGATGADLGVQDDLEVLGKIYGDGSQVNINFSTATPLVYNYSRQNLSWDFSVANTWTAQQSFTNDDSITFGKKIIHDGDTDTFLQAFADDFNIVSGGDTYFRFSSPFITPVLQMNPNSINMDTRISSDNELSLVYVDGSADHVGFGTIVTPQALVEIEGSATEGREILLLDQDDGDQPFINFDAVTIGDTTLQSVTNQTNWNNITRFIQVEINGQKGWIPFYNDPDH